MDCFSLGGLVEKVTHTKQVFQDLPMFIEDSDAPWTDLEDEELHYFVFRDKYAVTPGHLLFVPKYNTIAVLTESFESAVRQGQKLVESGECAGFNVGLNYGQAAGQTVPWPHIHLIPRRNGDVEDPIGGVRNVIPGKGNYKK